MKKIHTLVLVSFFFIAITPAVALASWWNPLSWNIFHKQLAKTAVSISTSSPTSSTNVVGGQTSSSSTFTTVTLPIVPTPKAKKLSSTSLTTLSNAQIIAKVKPSVVYLSTDDNTGSGMIISSDGYILTNAHVVKGYTNVSVSLPVGDPIDGVVVGRDENIDVAVVKIYWPYQKAPTSGLFAGVQIGSPLRPVEFGDSSKVNQGDKIFAFGYPFGINQDVDFQDGIIARRLYDGDSQYFETSAQIHPGNSGGPLVNLYGQVVGINNATLGNSIKGIQIGETLKLAIPINAVKNLISALKAGRNVVVNKPVPTTSQDTPADTPSPVSPAEKKQDTAALQQQCQISSEASYEQNMTTASRLTTNDPETEQLLTQIQSREDSAKSQRDSSISLIRSEYDPLIASTQDSYNRLAGAQQAAGERNGVARYTPSQMSGILSDNSAQEQSAVSQLQNQEQQLISQADTVYQSALAQYEMAKQQLLANVADIKRKAEADALSLKNKAYQDCMNQH